MAHRKRDLYRKVRKVDRDREAGVFADEEARIGRGRSARLRWRAARRDAMPMRGKS